MRNPDSKVCFVLTVVPVNMGQEGFSVRRKEQLQDVSCK